MSLRYPGGLIRKNPLTLDPALGNAANGIFKLSEAAVAIKNGTWPAYDPYFDQTTLLLHGDGTNGAQNNTFLDSSTNNFTITRNGNTTQGTFSPFSQDDGKWGAYFDGSGDYLTLSSSPPTSLRAWAANNYTFECWFYTSTLTGLSYADGAGTHPTLIGNRTTNNASDYWGFGPCTDGVIRLYYYNGSTGNTASSGLSIVLNQWNHIAFTKTSSGIQFFCNGVGSSFVAINGTPATDSAVPFLLGIANNTAISGYVASARIVNGTAVYSGSTYTVPTTPLTAITNTSLLTCQSNRFVDNSSNNFAITVNGNTSIQPFSPFAPSAAYSAATNGGSGYFDGSGDYLSIADNAAFEFGSGNFTIEGWINPSALPTGLSSIVTKSDGTGGAYAPYLIGRSNSNIIVRMSSSGSSWDIANAVSFGTLTVGQWFHFALVRNGTTITGYLNGVGTTIATTSASLWDNSNALLVGAIFASSSYIESWNGYISNVRLVKGTAVYTSNFTPPTSPVTAITNTSLLLNFTNAGILDNTGRNDLETVGNAQISTSVKKFGTGSLAFDGTGDYLTSNAAQVQNFTFGTGDFTVEFWLYLNSTTTSFILDMRPSSTDGAYPVLYNNSGSLEWFISSATRIASSSLSTGQWYHIAVCRSGTSTKMFLNGTQTGSTYTDSNNYICATTGRPWFGIAAYNGTGGLNGYIDDLRITKGVARYTSNFTPQTSQWQDQ